jgi:hypothetical protein
MSFPIHRRAGWGVLAALLLTLSLQPDRLAAQPIRQDKGVDARVDYAALTRIGPWDDRNYALTREDLALLAPNEHEQRDPVPAFFRVAMRKANPKLRREGTAQYPRSALQIFQLKYGGYLIDGKLYRGATYRDGAFQVAQEDGIEEAEFAQRALTGEVRVTSPVGAAESAVKINHVNPARVIAGSNGPGGGQVMHHSADGGTTWAQAAALPLGGTCCDPTVDWSFDGSKAYTATLGNCGFAGCGVWFYRSGDNGATWTDLGADPRRELSNANSDKEYLHVDKFGTSPHRDNLYLTWHDNNVLRFARSTDFGQTWSAPVSVSNGANELGIGSDIATDKNGNVYYVWPAFNSRRILVRKSTDGGATFQAVRQVATTNASFIFPIPSMETRQAFVYVAADVDTTNGAFANRIYTAWTDSTAATTGTPANNHARIQVAFSSDGGATWTVRTPHPTADLNAVDRFHPWLSVGSDGTVYVVYYDTRHSVNRTGVDFYFSQSTDGGNSWSAPARLTGVTSPNLTDGFEWGDYNGLDVVASQFLSVFTDNRNEGGGAGNSPDVYAAAANISGPSCTPVTASHISHFTGANCQGEEHYYTPYFNSDGIRRSWNGQGCWTPTLRTVKHRSWRGSNGVCHDDWPSGNTLSGFLAINRPLPCTCGEESCAPVQQAYRSHFTGANCTGDEHYYTPYFSDDGVRRTWNGTGCVGRIRRTVTNRSWRSADGVCHNDWPAGNTLSDFVKVYR